MAHWKVSDVKVGQIMPKGNAYAGAEVVSVASNGWVKCKWADGRTFSVRVHWLTPLPTN